MTIPYGVKVFRTFLGQRNRSMGLIIEYNNERIFYKSVLRRKHFHRNHQSWAIATNIINELHNEKVELIVLDIKDEGMIYVSLDDFDKYSIIDQFKGYEEQNFLHERYWGKWGWNE